MKAYAYTGPSQPLAATEAHARAGRYLCAGAHALRGVCHSDAPAGGKFDLGEGQDPMLPFTQAVFGHEVHGEVAAIGAAVTGWWPR